MLQLECHQKTELWCDYLQSQVYIRLSIMCECVSVYALQMLV